MLLTSLACRGLWRALGLAARRHRRHLREGGRDQPGAVVSRFVVSAGYLARRLSRYVKKTPAGIGLGIPETMQLAIDEVGPWRILRGLGSRRRQPARRRAAGPSTGSPGLGVRAIDGPTAGTLPPFDTHAKLPPADPAGVAAALSKTLSGEAAGTVEVVIVDANDRGVNVLGTSAASPAEDLRLAELVEWLFGDNPLGQGDEQTPVALLRRLGELDD